MTIILNLTTSLIHFTLKGWENVLFWQMAAIVGTHSLLMTLLWKSPPLGRVVSWLLAKSLDKQVKTSDFNVHKNVNTPRRETVYWDHATSKTDCGGGGGRGERGTAFAPTRTGMHTVENIGPSIELFE